MLNLKFEFYKKMVGIIFSCISFTAGAQALIPSRDPGHSILVTAFALSKPAQFTDIDDIALGLPREIARRLEESQQFNVRTIPELLSTDWQLSRPSPKFLLQVAAAYDVHYVVSGEIRNAGIRDASVLFGLWSKKVRSIELDMEVYDAKTGNLLNHYHLNSTADGDVLIGAEQAFGGDGFSATPYGKAILNVADQAAEVITRDLIIRP